MRRHTNFVLVSLAVFSMGIPAVQASDQQIFQDEQQMLQMNNGQVQQEVNQDAQYKEAVQAHDTADQSYRLYAEQRINELEKIKHTHGSPALTTADGKQLYALETWLSHDNTVRAQEQAHIKQLDQAIANLSQQRNATFSDLGSDINAMREDQERKAEDDKFNQMMKINQFNELQSEMGNASWGGSPTDGTWNSVGGRYGFGGGYGYSYGGGRRW